MKKFIRLTVVLTTVSTASLVFGQGGYPFLAFHFNNPFTDLSFLGAGARAHAMGGAFYAVADDPSALTWNPAGLTQIEKDQMSMSFHHTRAENQYSGNYSPSAGNQPFAGDKGQSIDQLAFGSVVIPFDLKGRHFVGSISIPNSVSEMRGLDLRAGQNFTQEINGRLSVASLGLATKFTGNISLGLAVNIYGHGYDRHGFALFELSPPPDDTVIVYRPRIHSSFSGWNATLGGMLKFEKLRLAAVFKTPFTESNPLKEKMDVRDEADSYIRGVKNPFLGIAGGILYDTKREWILPSIFGFGAAYQASDNLLLAADFDYKPFSKAWFKGQDNVLDPGSPFVPVDLKWHDINQIRIGGEYKFKVNRFTVPLRAGYRNDPKVFENVDNNYAYLTQLGNAIYFPGNGSQVKGDVITLGSGVAFGQVAFDVTWEFGDYDFEERGVMESGTIDPDTNLPAELIPFSRTTKVSNNRVIFNFTGVF